MQNSIPKIQIPIFAYLITGVITVSGTIGALAPILMTRRNDEGEFNLSRAPEMYALLPIAICAWCCLCCCAVLHGVSNSVPQKAFEEVESQLKQLSVFKSSNPTESATVSDESISDSIPRSS